MMPVQTDFGLSCPRCNGPVRMRRVGGGHDMNGSDPVFKQYYCQGNCNYEHTHDYDSMAWEWLKRVFS